MHFIIEYKITGSLFSSIYLWGRELNSKTILVYFSVMSSHVINMQPVNICRLENHIVVFRFHKMILVDISVMSVCAGNMQPALKSQKTPYPKSTSALSVKIPQVTNVLFMVLKKSRNTKSYDKDSLLFYSLFLTDQVYHLHTIFNFL